ncbi:hypothetical protein ACJMK2_037772 [Sinanodonta woodiana]|uniref:Calpain-B n=1 Tax=Sinanodonta woodiana TaxID=1069815 RepID=A0ABD3WNK8_SINWO
MTYQSTRTTTRVVRIGGGPPKVETKTYTYGGDSGSGQADGGMNFGIKSPFGFHKIRIGGDVDGDSCGGTSHTLSCTQRPSVVGRSTRKDKKNPFAGIVNQNYEEIRKTCKEENCLFEDPEFPAEDGSIFFSRRPPRPFEWKRPHEICKNPLFVSSGASRFDVQQGELGDCWLLAAVASLTINQKLLMRVVPHDQDFTTDYCGLFHFFFWHQGQWTEVVVDDRLPTYAGQLVFMHSAEKNEFWSALMEKAYAKLVGSYESLKGGSTSEAMEDFTGGVTEMFDLKKAPANLSEIMLKAHERGSLMGCSIDADENELEARLSNGLVVGHAYSITAVKMMEIKTPRVTGKIAMVRVRNPWGNEAEWKGAWSDKSPEWQFISEQEKRNIGLTFDDDGEFWMSFDDWRKNFQKIEICNLGPDSIDEEDAAKGKKRWEAKDEHGEWIRRVNAGGCRNYLESFWTNPQYRVTLVDPDDDDKEDMCTMLIGLLQKDRRKKRKEGMDMLTIGYVIYKLKDDGSNDGPLDMKFFKFNASVAKSPSFINLREVCGRHKLPPGTYVVVPSTFEPQQEAQFLIRIFTEKKSETVEVDQGTGLIEDQTRPPVTDKDKEQSKALKESFRRIAGEDMEVDCYELKDILNTVFTKEFSTESKFKFEGFNLDTCRSMIAMHDGDLSGKLGFDEFKALWEDLRKWKTIFKDFDKDGSGLLSTFELRAAFGASGFRLSNRVLSSVIMRYSNKEGQIEFGDFVCCAIRLKTMLASHKNMDPQNKGIATFDIDTFIQTTMYS